MVMLARKAGAKGPSPMSDSPCDARVGLGYRWTALLARSDRWDLAAAALFAVLVALIAFTFRDYAISNDEEVQQHYGALIVAYYGSGFADQALFHFRDLYLYGGLFDVIAVGLGKILPLDPYDVRHLLCAFIGI